MQIIEGAIVIAGVITCTGLLAFMCFCALVGFIEVFRRK